MNKIIYSHLFLLIFVSCSTTKSDKVLKKELTRDEEHFFYSDKNGQYIAKISSGYNKKEHSYFSKRSLEVSDRTDDKILEQSIVLSELGKIKKNQFLIGFALETENEIENAKLKIQKKNLDLIVLNSLNDKGAGFGQPTNKVTFIDSNFTIEPMDLKSKEAVAFDIINKIFYERIFDY